MTAPTVGPAQPGHTDTKGGARTGVLLPVVVYGVTVLVPLDAATVATSGLGPLLDDLEVVVARSPADAPAAPAAPAVRDGRPVVARALAFGDLANLDLDLDLDEMRHVATALEGARRHLDDSVGTTSAASSTPPRPTTSDSALAERYRSCSPS